MFSSPICRAAPHPISPSLLLRQRALPSQAEDLASVLAEFCTVSAGPFLQSLQVSLDGGLALKHISWCSLFGVTYKLPNVYSNTTSAHWYIKYNLSQDRPLQYSTCYWPLARITRIIKSCLEMHSKACQWHEIISVLSELWASRSWYKSGQLKATRILRQHKGIAEVLQSCLIFLTQACCIDFRGGSSWLAHVRVVLLSPGHPSVLSQPKQPPWLPDQDSDFCLHSKNSDPVAKVKRKQHCHVHMFTDGKSFGRSIWKEDKCFKGPVSQLLVS